MQNLNPLIVVRGLEEARSDEVLLHLVNLWIIEEASELAEASTSAAKLDALLDLSGVCAMGLSVVSAGARRTAFAEFRRAQAARDRPFTLPQLAVRGLEAILEHDASQGAHLGHKSKIVEILISKGLARGWLLFTDRRAG